MCLVRWFARAARVIQVAAGAEREEIRRGTELSPAKSY